MTESRGRAARSCPVPFRVRLGREIVKEMERHFRECGCFKRECVVYVAADLSTRTSAEREAIDVYHPQHDASAVHYQVATSEMQRLTDLLYSRRQQIIMQVHTHPGAAFHSSADDEGVFVPAPGMLSLVVPGFCRSNITEDLPMYLTEYQGSGAWLPKSLSEVLIWTA